MKSLIPWFARNPVAANLLMILIAAAGILTLPSMRREFLPEFSADLISVRVPYPGATPSEVESGVLVLIEEAVRDLEGIDTMRSVASEGLGLVQLEALSGTDVRRLMEDVKARVDGISNFPVEAERPVVAEAIIRREAITLAIYGQVNETELKRWAQHARDELIASGVATQVDLAGVRQGEIAVSVPRAVLDGLDLDLGRVATAIKQWSLDLPAGNLRSVDGAILVRAQNRAHFAQDLAAVPVVSKPDGGVLTLGEIATLEERFEEVDRFLRLDGKPAALLEVMRTGEQDLLAVTDGVRALATRLAQELPPSLQVSVLADRSKMMRDRMDLLTRNAISGLILVFISLALFLRLDLAFWVALGVPLSFLGALAVLPLLGGTLNMISLFAFILVLGIVVDDAIVVGESVYEAQLEHRGSPLQAAVHGAQRVAVPVMFSVLTTVVAFVPLAVVPGVMGKFFVIIPQVVILCLLFSLIESQLVLPAHLGHRSTLGRVTLGLLGPLTFGFLPWLGQHWEALRLGIDRRFRWSIARIIEPFVERCVHFRYVTISVFGCALVLIAVLYAGKYLRTRFFPNIEVDTVDARVTLPEGVPLASTDLVLQRLERAALQLQQELSAKLGPEEENPIRHVVVEMERATSVRVILELTPSEVRPTLGSRYLVERWRALAGDLPDVEDIVFRDTAGRAGEALRLEISGPDHQVVLQAAHLVAGVWSTLPGVVDLRNSWRSGKAELTLRLRPEATALGLTLGDVARQVRYAIYGAEADRLQRGRDEVRVMVRVPDNERASPDHLEALPIRLPAGGVVSLTTVADVVSARAPAAIDRIAGRRMVAVIADLESGGVEATEAIARALAHPELRALTQAHPGLRIALAGEERENTRTRQSLLRSGLLALLTIYALIAVAFRSYIQPAIIVLSIPFGLGGAVAAHALLGYELSIMSLFGMVALMGVVVNDNIVLIDRVNQLRQEQVPWRQALPQAVGSRFRAIILTSLTTFAGLFPMLLETSMQARFLVPMAISLGFGVVLATIVTLLLVPAVYGMIEDVRQWGQRLARRLGALDAH